MGSQYRSCTGNQSKGNNNYELDFLWSSVESLCRQSTEAIYQVMMAIPNHHVQLRRCLGDLAVERSRLIGTRHRTISTELSKPTILNSFIQDIARNYQKLGCEAVESRQGIPALSHLVLVDRVTLSYLRNAVRRLPLNAETIGIASVIASLQMNNDRMRDCWRKRTE
ncbi:MAG: hypothetical protein R3F50_19065 [Gammaproteobacteria bacterium]